MMLMLLATGLFQQQITTGEVVSALESRSRLPVRATFDLELFQAADSIPMPTGGTTPSKDLTYNAKGMLLEMVPGKIRFERLLIDIPLWENGKDMPRMVSTFDGVDSMAVNSPTSHANFNEGSIYQGEEFKDAVSGEIAPLLLMYRPFDTKTGYGLDISKFSEPVVISEGGIDYVRMEGENNGCECELWLTRNGLRVFRYIEFVGDPKSPYFDVQSEYDDDLLVGWCSRFYLPGTGGVSCSYTAANLSLDTAAQIDDSRFRVEFPKNSIVYDDKYGKQVSIDNEGKVDVLWDRSDIPAPRSRTVLLVLGILVVPMFIALYLRKKERLKADEEKTP